MIIYNDDDILSDEFSFTYHGRYVWFRSTRVLPDMYGATSYTNYIYLGCNIATNIPWVLHVNPPVMYRSHIVYPSPSIEGPSSSL